MKKWFLLCVCCLPMAAYAQFSDVRKGDILEINGVKGIVFSVDENREHGTMMSIRVLRGKKNAWCAKSKYASGLTMSSRTDGKANTDEVFRFVDVNGIDLSEFPAFEWCRSLGEGWYIPAVGQLEQFVNYWLGNENELDWDEDSETDNIIDESIPQPKLVNRKILEAGGIPFLNGVYTSTKDSNGKIYIYTYNSKGNWWKFYRRDPMNTDLMTVGRAFYDF